jgi:sec-independent protein translocase protein TatA
MGGFSLIHWIILGLFLLLLFGGSRFSNMMKDVAKGMKSFKEGMADEDDEKVRRHDEQRRNEPPRQLPREEATREPIDVTPTEPAQPPRRDDEAR